MEQVVQNNTDKTWESKTNQPCPYS